MHFSLINHNTSDTPLFQRQIDKSPVQSCKCTINCTPLLQLIVFWHLLMACTDSQSALGGRGTNSAVLVLKCRSKYKENIHPQTQVKNTKDNTRVYQIQVLTMDLNSYLWLNVLIIFLTMLRCWQRYSQVQTLQPNCYTDNRVCSNYDAIYFLNKHFESQSFPYAHHLLILMKLVQCTM